VSRFLFLYAGMTVVASLLARWGGCPSLFSVPAEGWKLAAGLALAVAVALGVVGVGRALERVPWYRDMALFLKRLMTSPDLLGPQLDAEKALVVALYSSVGEEALFRGFVQPWFILRLQEALGAGPLATAAGVLLASGVFGLLHFPLVRELIPWTAFAVLAGVLFGALAAWSGSLLPPIVAHLLINWLNIRRLVQLKDEPESGAGPSRPG
jgi:hypothetical protein